MSSNLEKILASGKFVVTGELGPPKGADPEKVIKKGELLKGSVDAVNITDNQTAIARLSSIAAGTILMRMDIEPVVQMTARDRNRLAIQSDILGAASLGMKNVLCLTGDHQKFGNHPQARGVFDIDSIQMIKGLKDMRDESIFMNGDKLLSGSSDLFIGAATNPFSDPYELNIIRLEKKINAGADFIQTQAVFNVHKFATWMDGVRANGLDTRAHILAGVAPVKSARIVERMRDFIPGMDVPDEIVDRMKSSDDPLEEGFQIALEIIKELKQVKGIHGLHLMPIVWEAITPRLVEESGLLPRPKV